MHETGLVRTLLRQAAEILAAQGGGMLREIHIDVGPLSGVEPLLVKSAFGQLAPLSEVCEAALVLREVPLTARCCACAAEFEIEEFHFVCPGCRSPRVQVTGGDEFRLRQLVVAPEDEERVSP